MGVGVYAPRLIQCLLGTASVLLVYWLGRACFSRRAGLFSAGIAAVYGPLVFYDANLLKPSLGLFLLLAGLAALLRAASGSGGGLMLLAGVLLAWSVLP